MPVWLDEVVVKLAPRMTLRLCEAAELRVSDVPCALRGGVDPLPESIALAMAERDTSNVVWR